MCYRHFATDDTQERAAFARSLRKELQEGRLKLAKVESDRKMSWMRGISLIRPSTVLRPYFENVSVMVMGLDGDELHISVDVAVSRQNSANYSDFRVAGASQQARYVEVIRGVMQELGCKFY